MLVEMYLDRIRKGSVSLKQAGEIVSDKGATVVLDAHNALGHLTGDQAIKIAVERARRFGAGLVAVRHGFHFGTARRFALKAAEGDCIGIVMCNTRPLMPAPGGAERVEGNNPIAIAVPSGGPAPRARHGHERSRDGQDPHGQEGRENSRHLGGQGRWQPDHRSGGSDCRHAAAGERSERVRARLPDRSSVRCASGGAAGSAVQPLYGTHTPYDCSHLFIAINIAHFGDRAVMRAAGRPRQSGFARARVRPVSRACSLPASRNGSNAKTRRGR